MSALSIIILIVQALLCILLTGVILLQSDRASGFSPTFSGGGSNDTYWGKNKGRSMEGTLEKYTKIGAALFIILAIGVNIILQF